jgi:outer membrane protein
MKKFFQISLLFIALFILAGVHSADAQNIAVVDTEALLKASPEMKRANSQLEATRKQYANRLEAKQQKFNTRYTQIMDLASKQQLTQQQELAFQKELQTLQTDIANSQSQFEKDLLAQEEKIIQPIFNKLKAEITTVAKSKGYRYVFNINSMIYYPPADNITGLVKKKLGYP